MNYFQQQSDLRFAIAMKRADRTEALRRWHERMQGIDLHNEDGLFTQLADAIAPLYEYLAKAQSPRSMGLRAWCLLYAARPELINYETMKTGADWFGVTEEAVCFQLKHLEKTFPGFTYVRRAAPPPEVLHERMMKANRASLERFRRRTEAEDAA